MQTDKSEVIIGGVTIELSRKDMQSLRLHVTPEGCVKLSVPRWLSETEVERFVLDRLGWIRNKLASITVPEIPDGCIILFGDPILRRVIRGLPERWSLENGELVLRQRFTGDISRTEALTNQFLREQLSIYAAERIAHYARLIGVEIPSFRIRKMSSCWGSWSPQSHTISLNLKLSGLSKDCLDYVVAHEVCHIPEPNHGPRFHTLLNNVLPINLRSNPLTHK